MNLSTEGRQRRVANGLARRLACRHSMDRHGGGPLARDLAPEVSSSAVTLMRAALTQCRWPVEGAGAGLKVCGEKIARGSYCAAHAARASGKFTAEAVS